MVQRIITKEGLDKLAEELKELKEVKLPDITEKIERAKELGDLSENAEYHDAKDQQGLTNARILEIEGIMKTAIIAENTESKDRIGMGSTFTAESEKGKKEFTIVSFNEADPLIGKISNESPIGEAFIGHKAGDTVTVTTPKGPIPYKITSII